MIINNTETIFIKLYRNFKVIGSIQRKLHNWWVWHSYKRPLIPSQGDSLLDYISCNEAQNYIKKTTTTKLKGHQYAHLWKQAQSHTKAMPQTL